MTANIEVGRCIRMVSIMRTGKYWLTALSLAMLVILTGGGRSF